MHFNEAGPAADVVTPEWGQCAWKWAAVRKMGFLFRTHYAWIYGSEWNGSLWTTPAHQPHLIWAQWKHIYGNLPFADLLWLSSGHVCFHCLKEKCNAVNSLYHKWILSLASWSWRVMHPLLLLFLGKKIFKCIMYFSLTSSHRVTETQMKKVSVWKKEDELCYLSLQEPTPLTVLVLCVWQLTMLLLDGCTQFGKILCPSIRAFICLKRVRNSRTWI